jgi:hypothetical protein
MKEEIIMKNSKDFELDAEDAAIVFKKDMSTELYVPNAGDENAQVNFEEHQHIFVAIAIMASTNDQEFRELVSRKMDTLFTKVEPTENAEECAPSDCGGCCGCGPEETPKDDS